MCGILLAWGIPSGLDMLQGREAQVQGRHADVHLTHGMSSGSWDVCGGSEATTCQAWSQQLYLSLFILQPNPVSQGFYQAGLHTGKWKPKGHVTSLRSQMVRTVKGTWIPGTEDPSLWQCVRGQVYSHLLACGTFPSRRHLQPFLKLNSHITDTLGSHTQFLSLLHILSPHSFFLT